MIVSPKKIFFSGGCSSRRGVCSIDISVENYRAKVRNFVQNEENNIKKQIIRSKNHFRQLFFCQRRPFFDNTARSFPLKIQRKQRKWKFSEKTISLKSLVWKGTKHFRQSLREILGRKMTKFFGQFPEKNVVLVLFKKNIFTSKCPLDT